MNTPEQAKEFWCPMARIAQIGAIETSASYNRALVKTHAPVSLLPAGGGEDKPIVATVLKIETQVSLAARCLGDGCAMWRWNPTTLLHPSTGELTSAGPGGLLDRIPAKGHCGLAPMHGGAA